MAAEVVFRTQLWSPPQTDAMKIGPSENGAFLRTKAAIGKLTNENDDVQSGINIVLKALESPIRQDRGEFGHRGLDRWEVTKAGFRGAFGTGLRFAREQCRV